MSREALEWSDMKNEKDMKVWALKVVKTRSSRPNKLNFGRPGKVWQPIASISEMKSVFDSLSLRTIYRHFTRIPGLKGPNAMIERKYRIVDSVKYKSI